MASSRASRPDEQTTASGARTRAELVDDEADEVSARHPHWLLTGALVSGAMWAVLIAVIAAALGNWAIAGYLTGAAAILFGLLVLAFRRARSNRRSGG